MAVIPPSTADAGATLRYIPPGIWNIWSIWNEDTHLRANGRGLDMSPVLLGELPSQGTSNLLLPTHDDVLFKRH